MPTNGYTNLNTHVYSLNFADDQVLIAQDHDDMEFMARKLKEEYENTPQILRPPVSAMRLYDISE